MPISKQIELRAKSEIVNSINNIIDRYIKEGLSIGQIKKYFKNKSNVNSLIYDINEVGKQYFDNKGDYTLFVIGVLNEILFDRKSEIETIKLQKESKTIARFNEFEFEKLTETIDYKDISAEYLFNDIGFANDDMDILASYFKTKEDYIEVTNKDYCIYTITDFNTDILKNNRIKSVVLLLADFQLEKMKNNVTRKILSGIYQQIPQDIEFMGILVKPHTILDKEKLKESIDSIVDNNILNIVTGVTKFKFDGKFGEDQYFVWKKIK